MSKLLTLSGCPTCGGIDGRKKRRSTMAYGTVWSPRYGVYIRKRRGGRGRRRGMSGLGQMTNIRASFDSIKEVLLFGGLAAGGAFITEHVWKMIGSSLRITDKKQVALAEIATGIAIGMVVARFTKKPKLGAAIAIGSIVKGGLTLFGQVAGSMSGIGLYDVSRPGLEPHKIRAPFSGTPAISRPGLTAQGADVPSFVAYPKPSNVYAY